MRSLHIESLQPASAHLSSRPLCLIVLTMCLAYVAFLLARAYLEYRVSEKGVSPHKAAPVDGEQADLAHGNSHGCLPPPQLPNSWPLGIDWIIKLFHYDGEQHLLSFLCSIADDYEPRNMLSQYLLFGPRAFHILRSVDFFS